MKDIQSEKAKLGNAGIDRAVRELSFFFYPVDKLTQIVHNKPPVNKCERKKILFPRGADDRFFLNVVVEFENPC